MNIKNGIIGIFVNKDKDPEGVAYKKITGSLEKYGISYRCVEDVSSDLSDIVLLVVLGGDGTILGVLKHISNTEIPLFSVNIGTLGFLSEVEINEFEDTVLLLKEDKGIIEKRLTIEAVCGNEKYNAVNEFCVKNSALDKMVNLTVYVNDDKAGKFHADGLLVSTPTGASAYSLSAGGPIVYPNANCLLITPICAHSVTARPIVVNADDVISIKSNAGNIMLATDWQQRTECKENEEIVIRKSEKTACFYRVNGHGFFERMNEKLIYNIIKE